MHFTPLAIRYEPGQSDYRPNWPAPTGRFLNAEHAGVYEATKDLPGWQSPGDSFKLYEAAYWSGSVILEVGVFGGRSAVVELSGALAAVVDREGQAPQYYGVDPDPSAFPRATQTLRSRRLEDRALLYRGDLRQFIHDLPVTPTMVFVDGSHEYEGVWADLEALSRFLCPGTPVLCHDFSNPEVPGVRRAVEDWIRRGAFEHWGVSANTCVLRASDCCRGGPPRGLSEGVFRRTASALATCYADRPASEYRPDVAEMTHGARQELGFAVA
ncbi:MAG: class I SAM-dependent methyltransferase [Phycisphaerales bacterium JB039]